MVRRVLRRQPAAAVFGNCDNDLMTKRSTLIFAVSAQGSLATMHKAIEEIRQPTGTANGAAEFNAAVLCDCLIRFVLGCHLVGEVHSGLLG